mmetsp:Transcript_42162/g.112501  ORF Transcript_42162/g.112501 Transcript_42162/m.112501 type:complete len:109 (+) Transcript_42162:592-918(+)
MRTTSRVSPTSFTPPARRTSTRSIFQRTWRLVHLRKIPSGLSIMSSYAQPLLQFQTCYEYWHEVYEGKPLPEGKWAHWRSVAGEAQVAKREKTEPHHNNYDGRNYITE